jgi:hypothetical protein
MNIMALTCELVARFWELLADASIVGAAQGPAAWMLSSKQLAQNTCAFLCLMLSCCTCQAGDILKQLLQNPGGQDDASGEAPGMDSMSADQCGAAGQGSPGGLGLEGSGGCPG